MSAALRIVFVCNDGEDCCPFLAAVRGAGFCVVLAHASEGVEIPVSSEPIAAITVHQENLQDYCWIAAELKRATPRVPIILFRDQWHRPGVKPSGVDAVLYADPQDDGLCRSAATFLRLILDKPTLDM